MRVLLLIFSTVILVALFVFPLEGGSPLSQSERGIGVIGEAKAALVLRRGAVTPTDFRFAPATSPLKGEDNNARVVSTSLCGDGYVLAMTPETDIAALSWQSGDPLSTTPKTLRGQPKAWDDAERLLSLNPTLVLFGPGEGRAAKPLLDKAGVSYVNLVWGEDFKSIRENSDIISTKLQSPAFEPGSLAGTRTWPETPEQVRGLDSKILYLSSSGGTAGPGTYVDAAIGAAGGTNIITTPGWHTPDPETMAALKPDLIITSFFKDGYASVNQAGLRNKVLQDKIKNTPRVNVPGKLWPCAGPGLYEATALISKAIEALE